MKWFTALIKILNKPYPEEESWWGYIRKLLIVSVFITFFLFIFQPFGISSLESNVFLICLGFGSMTFAGVIIYELTVGLLLRLSGLTSNWTFGKWILSTLCMILFISIANFIFSRLLIFGDIEWSLLPAMIYGTFMIGIIPITILGGMSLYRQEKKYESIANEYNLTKTGIPVVQKEESVSVFEISAPHIKYIEALQNYVKIGYVNAEGGLKVQTERGTLKEILSKVEGTSIIKCHRSFLVNKDAIVSATGNAQGLLLQLSEGDKPIPVSRSYVASFRGK
ncbi:MAG: LytTR family DNA-binding domain-containing protein [Cyclobacteriaceae bacterium]